MIQVEVEGTDLVEYGPFYENKAEKTNMTKKTKDRRVENTVQGLKEDFA